MKRRSRTRLLVILALVIGVGLIAWRGLAAMRPATPPVQRATYTVATSDQQQIVTITGTFEPRTAAYLSFTAPGTVKDVSVRVGDTVREGERLATIDDAQLRASVNVARAQVDAAQEQVNEALDQNVSQAAITSARAGLDTAQQQLRLAEQQLSDATLRSTIDGVVAAVNIKKGSTSGTGDMSGLGAGSSSDLSQMGGGAGGMSGGSGAGGGSGLSGLGGSGSGSDASQSASTADIVVIQPGTWDVSAPVSSNDIALVKKGQPATVTAAGSTTALKAKVASVGLIAETSSGASTFPARLTINGQHDDIYMGATNTVAITVRTFTDILTVPTAAIDSRDGRTVVTKVVGGKEEIVPITMGVTFGEQTEVTSGLAEGDQIVYTVAGG